MEHTENNDQKSDVRTKSPVRLLTLRESARYLGRSEASMRVMIYKRILPVIKESERSKIWIDLKDLDAWIENKKGYL